MKKPVLFIILLFFISTCLSQESSDSLSVEKFLFKIKGYPTGIEAEIGLSKKSTLVLNAEAFIVAGFYDDDSDIEWIPLVDVQYRYFFNFEKRQQEGKNTSNNSGNFVALKSVTYFLQSVGGDPDFFNFTGPVWGLQRNYYDHWNIALELGLGVVIGGEDGDFAAAAPYPIISFNVGYNF